MDKKIENKLTKLFVIELGVGFAFLILLVLSGISGLALVYVMPIIPIIFTALTISQAKESNWQPYGWIPFLIINVIMSVYFVWYCWINDPIKISAWH